MTAFFRQRSERKWHRLEEEEARAGAEAEFTAYGITLAPVTSFMYIERVILVDDEECPTVVRNLCKAWRKWERLMQVLRR